jgi:outer membrane receptor protein involved in Fe transport
MKKRFYAALLLIAMAMADFYALAGSITGKIIDAVTKEPMEFVNVTIRKVGQDKPMPTGEATDDKGEFTLSNIANGSYIVKVTYVGYTAVLKNAVVTAEKSSVDLGTLSMKEDKNVLKEVQVVGVKQQVRFDLDKKVYNVDQNIAAAGASASEILETVPSVEVDNDGNVSLRGNSSVTVWINGKPSGLTADNRGEILDQLPAESIEKIEITTNPSAKYSAEGTAGIINIVLKRNRQGGYFGSVQAGVNSLGGYNLGANLNYNNSRWDTYVNASVRYRHRTGHDNSWRDYTDGSHLYTLGENKRRNTTGFLRAGATYHLTTKDDIYLNGFGMLGSGWSSNDITYDSDVPGSFSTGLNHSHTDQKNRGGNVDFGFTHKFTDSHTLDLSVSFNTWRMPFNSLYHRQFTYGDSIANSWQSQDNHIKVNNWVFQIDYVNQFTKQLKLEAGYKGTLSYEDSPLTTYSGTAEDNLTVDAALFNRFIYDQNIQAAYATFGGKFGDFNFSGGLRGEYWHDSMLSLGYGQIRSDYTPFKVDKFSLFPSLFLSYKLPKDNELQVNYTRRIQRPWGGQLNSFKDISDPTNISYGNPYLKPEYSNAFELNYIKSWTDHILSFSGYYRTTSDVIQRINFLVGGVMNNTSENVSHSRTAGSEIVLKDKFFKKLDLTTTVNLYYYKLDGYEFLPEGAAAPITGAAQDNFSWNIRMMASMQLPWDMSFQANGNYNAKEIIAQGYRKPQFRVDLGLKKTIGKWTVTLGLRDVFNSRKWHTVTSGNSYTQEAEHRGGGRRLNFAITYNFGNMKAKKPNKQKSQQDEGGSGYDSGGGDD